MLLTLPKPIVVAVFSEFNVLAVVKFVPPILTVPEKLALPSTIENSSLIKSPVSKLN